MIVPIMHSPFSAGIRHTTEVERGVEVAEWRPKSVSVVPIEAAAPTNIVAALIALIMNRLGETVVTVDPSHDRAMSFLLGAGDGGDLLELGFTDLSATSRQTVDNLVDFATATNAPVICTRPENPGLNGGLFETALKQIRRRYRGFVADIPGTVAADLMPSSLALSDMVVAVSAAQPSTSGVVPAVPSWLFHNDNPLYPFLARGQLVLVRPYLSEPSGCIPGYPNSLPVYSLGIEADLTGRWNLPITTGRGLDLVGAPDRFVTHGIELTAKVFGT